MTNPGVSIQKNRLLMAAETDNPGIGTTSTELASTPSCSTPKSSGRLRKTGPLSGMESLSRRT